MLFNPNPDRNAGVEAARALIAVYEAGIVAIPAYVPTWQRDQIARELRIAAALLQTIEAPDVCTVACDVVTNIRHGLAQGTLVVSRDDAAAHVQATLRAVQSELDAMPAVMPAVCFDAPAPGARTAA